MPRLSRRKSAKHSISRKTKRSKKQMMNRKQKKQNRSKSNKSQKRPSRQRGGASCDLATVQEPGFSIPALGDIAGLNIDKSRGVIYRPNCKPDLYQAMIPN